MCVGTILRIGEWYAPWGKLVMVGSLQGERYYWFVDAFGSISMMPACAVETV
jgi:hypothetical protein